MNAYSHDKKEKLEKAGIAPVLVVADGGSSRSMGWGSRVV